VQNIILVFPEEDEASIANIYIAIQVDIRFAAEYIRANYPHACRVILLPKSFSPVVATLSRMSIQCSPCHNIILQELAQKGEKPYISLMKEFPTEEVANVYCINYMIRHYIMIALSQFASNTQKVQVLRRQALRVMDENKANQLNWLMLESYLGSMLFEDDLRRTCAEFYAELKKTWGFTPKKWCFMN
jgi:hypothetical protein